MKYKFFPFLNWIGDINKTALKADFFAGLTGAVVVLPQGVAFAMIAGLPPVYGLYTAIVLPVVAALFGSSRHLISGPTTAISIIVFSSVSQFADPGTPGYIQTAISITLIAGILQFILGLSRLGALVNFVSHSVVLGFTAGAALLIASNQLKYVFDIQVLRGSSFSETLFTIGTDIGKTNFYTLVIGLSTILMVIIFNKINRKLPGMLLAMIFGSILSLLMDAGGNIQTIGEIPTGLPPFGIPEFNLTQLKNWFPSAFAIAILGLIEAVAIGRSVASHSGQIIDGNQEFIGQGLSNIVGSFFSCYAGSGSFTRTGVNFSAGARTPLSAIFAAIFLLFIILFVGPLAAYLPISVMGGIIMLVAYNLINFSHIRRILRTSKRESTVLLITFFATLLLDLEYAIYLGIIFSLIFYLNRTSQPRFVEIAPDSESVKRTFRNVVKYRNLDICPQLMVFRIEGSIFFGAVESVSRDMEILLKRKEKNLLIVANNINLIDSSGADFLENTVRKWRLHGKQIYFSGFKLRSRALLAKGGFWENIGDEYFFDNKGDAIFEIFKKLDGDICRDCKVRIFRECKQIPCR